MQNLIKVFIKEKTVNLELWFLGVSLLDSCCNDIYLLAPSGFKGLIMLDFFSISFHFYSYFWFLYKLVGLVIQLEIKI